MGIFEPEKLDTIPTCVHLERHTSPKPLPIQEKEKTKEGGNVRALNIDSIDSLQPGSEPSNSRTVLNCKHESRNITLWRPVAFQERINDCFYVLVPFC